MAAEQKAATNTRHHPMELLLNEDIYRRVIVELYLGEFCRKYQRRAVCPDPIA